MKTPTEPRLRRRRRLVWATVLPAIVIVVLAARFLTLPMHMGQAQDAHGGGDGAGMVDAAEKLGVLNIVERWRAPFVEGTGKSMDGDLEAGRSDLETALERTSDPQDDCTVRTNLVITISQQADAAEEDGDEEAKKEYAEEGLTLIEEGPEGCLDGSDDGNGGDAGRKQQEEQEKLEEQQSGEQEEQDEGDEGDEEQQGGSGGEEDPQKKELEERNQQGQSESEEKQRQDEADEEGDTGGVDKPW